MFVGLSAAGIERRTQTSTGAHRLGSLCAESVIPTKEESRRCPWVPNELTKSLVRSGRHRYGRHVLSPPL